MTDSSPVPSASNVRRLVFSVCLIASAILMIVGHYAVMSSGAWFDPVSGEKYNLLRRWVSDFAAKWPEGLWIKTSIVFFCAAVIVWCRSTKTSAQLTGKVALTRFLRWILASLIVIGLALVIIYDMSPPQYRDGELSLIAKLWGKAPGKVPADKSALEWTIEGHHNAGFAKRRLHVGIFGIRSEIESRRGSLTLNVSRVIARPGEASSSSSSSSTSA